MHFTLRASLDDRLLSGPSIAEVFSEWLSQGSRLAELLSPFARLRPLRFFDREALSSALALFEADSDRTLQALYDVSGDLSRGFHSLFSEGPSWAKDSVIRLDAAGDIAAFENLWHPEYERYCEYVFNKLICLPLRIYELKKSRDYLVQTLGQRVTVLTTTNGCTDLAQVAGACRVTMRNAIAHGGVSFGLSEIRYADRKETVALDAEEFGQVFDRLVDTCHGLAAAVICFLARAEARGVNIDLARLPFGMFYGAIGLAAYASDWKVTTATENLLADGRRQLNIYCETPTRLAWVHRRGSAKTAVEVYRIVGKRYDRLAVFVDFKEQASALRTFRTEDLERAKREGWDLPKVSSSAVETDSCLFDAGPVEKWKHILKYAATTFLAENPLVQPLVAIREERPGASQSRAWITAEVFWLGGHEPRRDDLLDAAKVVVSKLQAKRVDGIKLETGRKTRPRVTHLTIRFHTQDARARDLSRRDFDHPGLAAIAEWSRSGWKKPQPHPAGEQVVHGDLKIVYLDRLDGGEPETAGNPP